MFYNEQLSIQPKDAITKSSDGQINRDRPIRDIVEATLKLNENIILDDSSKNLTTDNTISNPDKSPTAV
jgi:hypothetical protein